MAPPRNLRVRRIERRRHGNSPWVKILPLPTTWAADDAREDEERPHRFASVQLSLSAVLRHPRFRGHARRSTLWESQRPPVIAPGIGAPPGGEWLDGRRQSAAGTGRRQCAGWESFHVQRGCRRPPPHHAAHTREEPGLPPSAPSDGRESDCRPYGPPEQSLLPRADRQHRNYSLPRKESCRSSADPRTLRSSPPADDCRASAGGSNPVGSI